MPPGLKRASRGPAGRPGVAGYEILGELGRGGMGVVYKARQLALNRLVALKMILAGGHAGQRELARFRTEAEAVARLQHPNIVQIYEVGEHDGRPLLLAGVRRRRQPRAASSPASRCRRARPPRLVETLARAMHYAHQRGIVHRDLKPANVLLTPTACPRSPTSAWPSSCEGDRPRPRPARSWARRSYMAPEQAAGDSRDVGPPADVYALGAILYEC